MDVGMGKMCRFMAGVTDTTGVVERFLGKQGIHIAALALTLEHLGEGERQSQTSAARWAKQEHSMGHSPTLGKLAQQCFAARLADDIF